MNVIDLGLISYQQALELQLQTHADVLAGGEPTLFLLEHRPVITLGRQGGLANLHVPEAFLRERGIELARTTRGGNITCHFPGQLVGYPILPVEKRPGGLKQLFFDIEESVIRTAARFDVAARRREGHPGVWTDKGKLCSIGIAVKKWVSYHGLALNVSSDTTLFDLITPCGIQGARPTSLSAEAGREISMHEVKDVFREEFQAVAHPALA
ncbi:lipoyl(octanoyl) transferase LipB [Paucidesulfovibrio longus]|uniref:lipoyl(octanoyl) transferase LipB n=1 Tax=Paucidesulfovibrio longus TaxID=889 RepID=UPI0003B5777A|nr:lipoyl(octanoyl) transferase LipB [Paucidesulfovibrio longus]